jgi:uncharacterized integral membrane protein
VRTLLGLVLLAFLGAVGLFAVQNTQTVTLRFADRTIAAPLALLAVSVYFLGMLSGWTVVGVLRRSFNRVMADPGRREG